ncbi:hypothetical protein PoB_004007500 [Plakobranchus ocellatus]|uniref:Uncharacterized protein n=1 Tax=Plakobranchus ocellatus TaxID=259542 RepID=A0AAV4AYX1_9GAST|nr:hypothetical protein PoB_004007500 [Plakobranchus ocellatus]
MEAHKRNRKQATNITNDCIRRILKIHNFDRVKKEELCQRTRKQREEVEIERKLWRWIEDSVRKPGTNRTHKALGWNLIYREKGKRGKDRIKLHAEVTLHA